jgi:hypothetical protein
MWQWSREALWQLEQSRPELPLYVVLRGLAADVDLAAAAALSAVAAAAAAAAAAAFLAAPAAAAPSAASAAAIATFSAAAAAAVTILQKKYPECGNKEGYAPLVTIPTLHQVHYLLFFMAVTHIVIGAIVLAISTTKLK